METSELKTDNVYFSFKKIKHLSSLLFGSISLGIIMNIFIGYRLYGIGIVVYRDLLYLLVLAIMIVLYYCERIKLTTALSIIAYFILTCYTLVLPSLIPVEGFSFHSYFLEIQFLVMLFGLILTIGVKPYHDLILGTFNFVFATVCIFLVEEFRIEIYLFYTSIVSAKCIVCYVIFENVFKLRRKSKTHHETIIKQNAQLLELTNFRKDIVQIIAHDLRSPIHQISSLLKIIKHSETEDEKNEVMLFINESVDNAYAMLENLLKWAMQSNDSLKEFTMINVYELILSLENQLNKQLNQKSLIIEKRINADVEIYYSKNVIESVARNLLINAVKFSPSNNTIVVYFEDGDTNFSLKFFNKIETTEMENIQQFNTVKHPLKSTTGTANEIGSGNGLFVCRQMLEKNNGELTLNIENNGVMATVFVTKTF